MTPKGDGEAKQQQILEAVLRVLAAKGYSGATISAVAAEAGVSRGLLHYYFANKEEMLAQAARMNLEAGVGVARQALLDCRPGQDAASVLLQAFRRLLGERPDFFNVYFEGWALVRHSEIIYAEMGALYREFRRALMGGLADAAARGVIAPRGDLEGLAAMVTALLDGLGLQLMTEPDLLDRPEVWEQAEASLRALLPPA